MIAPAVPYMLVKINGSMPNAGVAAVGSHFFAEQEIDKPDLSNGRDTGNNEIYRYQKHTCNRHKPEYQKDAVNKVFKCSFSFCGTVII